MIQRTQGVVDILTVVSRLIGLRLCFHERLGLCRLPVEWANHMHPACFAVKGVKSHECVAFDGHETHLALAGIPEGRIHICPGGWTEIAVPVFREGVMAGVLFAGPCWFRKRPPPLPSLVVSESTAWLEDRREILRGAALRIGTLLAGSPTYLPPDRASRILRFLNERVGQPTTLADLAFELKLSPSRASHFIRERFGVSYKELALRIQFQEAAHLLTRTDLSVGEIARLVGIHNPNYFSTLFAKRFQIPPRAYRIRYGTRV